MGWYVGNISLWKPQSLSIRAERVVAFARSVVTGATAGIGRDFALQLAAAGFNVFLASRTTLKLEEISQEISACSENSLAMPSSRQLLTFNVGTTAAKYPGIKTQIHSIDFSSPKADYAALGKELDNLDVGVLSECILFVPLLRLNRLTPSCRAVNNVGKSYEEPTFFQDLPDQDMNDIVEINV